MFARVLNNTVVATVGSLPSAERLPSGETISGLHLADPAVQREAGWYPITVVQPALGRDEQYGEPVFTIGATEVTARYPAVPVPPSTTNARVINNKLNDALATVLVNIATAQSVQDLPNLASGTLTAAQLSSEARINRAAIKGLARIVKNDEAHQRIILHRLLGLHSAE